MDNFLKWARLILSLYLVTYREKILSEVQEPTFSGFLNFYPYWSLLITVI